MSYDEIDFDNLHHRLYLSAYYGALLNYHKVNKEHLDIYDAIDFSKYKSIVIIGYIRPLVKKLNERGIAAKVFDHGKQSEELEPMENQVLALQQADCIVTTATTIFNKTYVAIVKEKIHECDLFLLGPSAIIDADFMQAFNITNTFGMTFAKDDLELLKIVAGGGGTQHFKVLGTKVFI